MLDSESLSKKKEKRFRLFPSSGQNRQFPSTYVAVFLPCSVSEFVSYTVPAENSTGHNFCIRTPIWTIFSSFCRGDRSEGSQTHCVCLRLFDVSEFPKNVGKYFFLPLLCRDLRHSLSTAVLGAYPYRTS